MSDTELRRLLADAAGGKEGATERLVELLYHELRRLARSQLARHRRSPTLHTTALVHEAYLRLAGSDDMPLAGRGHFFALAARAMRQVIVDHARAAQAQKRGGGAQPLPLDENRVAIAEQAEELLALDEALLRLASHEPRWVQVVECRFFVGLTEDQTAEALELSRRTVQRDWLKARAWLLSELDEGQSNPAP